MAQHPKLRDFAFQRRQRLRRAVGRAVIHENDFMVRLAGQRGRDLPGQGGDIFGLILDRHDHRDGQ